MSDARGPGIEFRQVWKKFRLGQRHDSLRDLIPAMGRRLVRRRRAPSELDARDFWALRDVSFEVRPGQALGVIGHNGAGKSTILKVLTHILRPTLGSATVRGRIGALIEVSAGFHQDLSGRENVYLQGAIMGMPAAVIARRFDEIVDFAGLAEFIDTPVKRYSSGMNARLGFAIAAHLDPEVLIIDEVLAVGDLAFQQRAFGRIREMVKRDIPVVVVSHQLDRIEWLCTEAILLERGRIARRGTPAECIATYVGGLVEAHPTARGATPVHIAALERETTEAPVSGQDMALRLAGHVEGSGGAAHAIGLRVRSLQTAQLLFASSTGNAGVRMPESGAFELQVVLQMNVPPGTYAIETLVWDSQRQEQVGSGPGLQVSVESGPTFWGSVQLNPRFRLAASALAEPVDAPAREGQP